MEVSVQVKHYFAAFLRGAKRRRTEAAAPYSVESQIRGFPHLLGVVSEGPEGYSLKLLGLPERVELVRVSAELSSEDSLVIGNFESFEIKLRLSAQMVRGTICYRGDTVFMRGFGRASSD